HIFEKKVGRSVRCTTTVIRGLTLNCANVVLVGVTVTSEGNSWRPPTILLEATDFATVAARPAGSLSESRRVTFVGSDVITETERTFAADRAPGSAASLASERAV